MEYSHQQLGFNQQTWMYDGIELVYDGDKYVETHSQLSRRTQQDESYDLWYIDRTSQRGVYTKIAMDI